MLKRLLAYALSLALACAPVLAGPSATGIMGPQAFHGPGSRGFLPTCSSQFSITNNIIQSNTFGTTWAVQHSGTGANPTLVTGIADPDGGTSATALTFPNAITSAASSSEIEETVTSSGASYRYGFGVWVQDASASISGDVTHPMYIWMYTSAANAAVGTIPVDGNWHWISANRPVGSAYTAAFQVAIGINETFGAPFTTGTTAAKKINVYHSQVGILYAPFGPSTYIATTTAFATQTFTVPCPPGVAFRDFSRLKPLTANPIITQNSGESYQAGGLSNPYTTAAFKVNGKYWGFANSTPLNDHTAWTGFSLYSSYDGLQWTEDTSGAPYFPAFGSSSSLATATTTGFTATVNIPVNACPSGVGPGATGQGIWAGTNYYGTVVSCSGTALVSNTSNTSAGTTLTFGRGTGTIAFYQLHPAFSPTGCNVSGTPYAYCVYWSGQTTTSTNSAIYMAYSNTIDSGYTLYGCSASTICGTPTAILPITSAAPTNINKPSLVSIVNAGSLNYFYMSVNSNAGQYTLQYTAPSSSGTSGNGTVLTFAGLGINTSRTPLTTDFDYCADLACYDLDSNVVQNSEGFCEYFYTAYRPATWGATHNNQVQLAGYAVAAKLQDGSCGPFFKFNGITPGFTVAEGIIPSNSSLYGSSQSIGDWIIMYLNGRFVMTLNYDNGTNLSPAMAAIMQDAGAY